MWAGGRLTFHAPLRTGRRATRESTIENIEDKTGRSGRLVFVTVQHRIECDGALCVEEEHDIVYRDALQPAAGAEAGRAPAGETWSRTVTADAVMLFRYSALTFNGHRIHYDRSYVTQEEGYPGRARPADRDAARRSRASRAARRDARELRVPRGAPDVRRGAVHAVRRAFG